MCGAGMYRLWQKQKRLKAALIKWNKETFGNIFENIARLEEEAKMAEKVFQEDMNIENQEKMRRTFSKLENALDLERTYWKQKANMKGEQKGDRNIKYFHAVVKIRRAKNYIRKIKLVDGSYTNNSEENLAINYFKEMMACGEHSLTDSAFSHIPKLIDERDNSYLLAPLALEEIKEVVFSCKREVAAGPDGFNFCFYQDCWEFICNDLFEVVMDFFEGFTIPKYFATANIVLIPKVSNAVNWKDFRPISLCSAF